MTNTANGVIFPLSLTTDADIHNGSTNTFLFGEKYLNPDDWTSGQGAGDTTQIFAGFAPDGARYSANGPRRDARGTPADMISFPFGSAHVDGLNMFTCDGSGHWMSYNVDPTTFANLCNRNNTNPIDNSKLGW
jgi:hypothetical protein